MVKYPQLRLLPIVKPVAQGYGFVEMSNDEEGQHAIEELNDAEYDGRTLSVSVARPRTEGDRPRNNNRGGYGNRERSNRY